MQVIGFNFTKISAERVLAQKPVGGINTNIEFSEIAKEEVTLLKEQDALRIGFKFSITYNEAEAKKELKAGEVVFEGNIILAASKDESKDILKGWKKKDISNAFKVPIFNMILRKCSTKALELEDEVGLPYHIPIPYLTPKSGE